MIKATQDYYLEWKHEDVFFLWGAKHVEGRVRPARSLSRAFFHTSTSFSRCLYPPQPTQLAHPFFPKTPCEWTDLTLAWPQQSWSLTFIWAASLEEKTGGPERGPCILTDALPMVTCPWSCPLPGPVLYVAVPFSARFSLTRTFWFHLWASHRFMSAVQPTDVWCI